MTVRLVVVGANAAGMSAASQARRRLGPDALQIVAFERGDFTSYSSCGIPYWIGGLVGERDDLVVRGPQEHRDKGIDVRMHHEVVGIDLDRREVIARDLADGSSVREGFDHLVYAAGAQPLRPEWAREPIEGVFGVQTLDDGRAVNDWLDGDPGRTRAVVVGAGYIGIEMAEALVRRGGAVTVDDRAGEPMSTVDPELGAMIRKAMVGLGIDVRTGVAVQGLEATDGRVTGVVTDAGTLPADVVILGLGVRANVSLARDAGLPVGHTGALRVDDRMAVPGHDGVWAVGDCVESHHRITGSPVHIALGTHANKQGWVAGINIGGGEAHFPGVIGTAITKICDLEIGRTGLNEREATGAGLSYVVKTVESTSRAGYLPDAEPLTVKLVAESGTGRLLGGQIIGHRDAAKRIDVIATAVWAGLTVAEITMLDLGYAPPFGPVWDPILLAARSLTSH